MFVNRHGGLELVFRALMQLTAPSRRLRNLITCLL
jgi:hypothetical protein